MSDQPWNPSQPNQGPPPPGGQPADGYPAPGPAPYGQPLDAQPPAPPPPPMPVAPEPVVPEPVPPMPYEPPPGPALGVPQPPTYGQMPPAAPPPAPYGQMPPVAPPPDYSQPPYSQPAAYAPVPPAAGAPQAWGFPLAVWGKRVGGYLLDAVLVFVPYFVFYILGIVLLAAGNGEGALAAIGGLLVFVGWLVAIAVGVWNWGYKQGMTGMSFGKSVMRLRVVGEQTGQPLGFGMSFVRQLAHMIDSAICYVGFLFPLWDAKRQTIADKIMSTLVLDVASDPNAGKFQWTLR